MSTRSQRFPSNYTKAADLEGRELIVTVARVTDEEFENDGKKQTKPVLHFKERLKPLVCNVTNYVEIESFLGPDDSAWVGRQIVVYPTMISFKGKVSEAVRVKRPPQGDMQLSAEPQPVTAQAAAIPAVAGELSDKIPF